MPVDSQACILPEDFPHAPGGRSVRPRFEGPVPVAPKFFGDLAKVTKELSVVRRGEHHPQACASWRPAVNKGTSALFNVFMLTGMQTATGPKVPGNPDRHR